MYKTATNSKVMVIAAIALSGFLAAGSVLADNSKRKAWGKPGMNPFFPGGNIVEVALAANDALGGGVFETVYTAATCDYFEGAIASILVGDDKVTLFAPTNAAFDALGLDSGNICSTFEETPEVLANILAYHVTEGRRFSNSVLNKNGNMKEIEMLNGGTIATKDGKVYDENMNEITIGIADVSASNGVIHVINKVLLPGAE